jgi:hypothetical protein
MIGAQGSLLHVMLTFRDNYDGHRREFAVYRVTGPLFFNPSSLFVNRGMALYANVAQFLQHYSELPPPQDGTNPASSKHAASNSAIIAGSVVAIVVLALLVVWLLQRRDRQALRNIEHQLQARLTSAVAVAQRQYHSRYPQLSSNPLCELSAGDLSMGQLLGQGAFGQVWQGRWQSDDDVSVKSVAIKMAALTDNGEVG